MLTSIYICSGCSNQNRDPVDIPPLYRSNGCPRQLPSPFMHATGMAILGPWATDNGNPMSDWVHVVCHISCQGPLQPLEVPLQPLEVPLQPPGPPGAPPGLLAAPQGPLAAPRSPCSPKVPLQPLKPMSDTVQGIGG